MRRFFFIAIMLATALAFAFTSCKDDEDVYILDVTMSPTDESREYPLVWGQNETLDVNFSLVADVPGWIDPTIKSIEIYLNDELIGSSLAGTGTTISHPLADIPKGFAVLKTITEITTKGRSQDIKLTKPFYLWITDVKPATTASINCQSEISNGEDLNCTFDYSCNVDEAELYSTELYLDGKAVASSTSSPFDISYKIEGLSNGAHEVQGVVSWTKKDSHMFVMRRATDKQTLTVK